MAHSIVQEGGQLIVKITDRLDAVTAPKLQDELEQILRPDSDIIFDFKELGYISSGGLRLLLSTFKHVSRIGTMEIINVVPDVMEVLEMSGFDQLFPVSE